MIKKLFFIPALFVLCWLYATSFNDIDYDFWARIAVGKMYFQTGHVLPYDIFSYTVTREWIDHEWGSGVVFYFFGENFGDFGLMMLKITLFFTVLFLITRIIKLQNPTPGDHRNILFYLVIILAVFFGIGHTVRCQLFTFTLFTLWIYVLERVRRAETGLLWIMPVTMLIWANFHGGFVSGIGLLIMYGAGEFLNRKPCLKYFYTLIPVCLVTLINPYGFKYLQYIFHATTMDRRNITEWGMTDLFAGWKDWYSLKIVILAAFISLVFYFVKNRPKFAELDKVKYIILAVTLYLAISHIKHQAFFVISAACFIYHDFYAIFKSATGYINTKLQSSDSLIATQVGEAGAVAKVLGGLDLAKNGLVYALILGCGIPLMIYNPIQVIIPINKFPLGSVEFVRQNELEGNLLTIFHWGSYAAWKLYPDCLIALDGRYEEVYPDSTFYAVGALVSHFNSPKINVKWDHVLNLYHTDIIILGTDSDKKKQAYMAMKQKEEWKAVYEDLISAVFVRKKDAKDKYKIPKLIPETVFAEKYDTKLDFNYTDFNK